MASFEEGSGFIVSAASRNWESLIPERQQKSAQYGALSILPRLERVG